MLKAHKFGSHWIRHDTSRIPRRPAGCQPPPAIDRFLLPDGGAFHGDARQPDRFHGIADDRRRIRPDGTFRLGQFRLSARHQRGDADLWQAGRSLRPQIRHAGGDRHLHARFARLRFCLVDGQPDCRPRFSGTGRRRHHGVDLFDQCRSLRAARTRQIPELFQPDDHGVG
ncbi:hypothetical protein D3C87_1545600 [compost metagenome]